MDPLESAVRRLAHDPAPALPLSRVRERLQADGVGIIGEMGTREVVRVLARYPDHLRLVEPWQGPWRALAPSADELPVAVREGLRAHGFSGETWFIPLAPPFGESPGPPALRRLRDTLRHLGRSLDIESPRAVARWLSMMRELDGLEAWLTPPTTPDGRGRSTSPPRDPSG